MWSDTPADSSSCSTKTPGVQISCSTIYRLMLLPSKARSSKELYMSLISVCVPSKRNNRTRLDHEDHHYTMAQVAYLNELFQLYEEECICISADDKNKINVGSLAVSRYFQLRLFFPTTDSPDFLDHDFPYPGAKISPCEYLILSSKPSKSKHRSRSLSLDRCRQRKNNCLQCLSPARQED